MNILEKVEKFSNEISGKIFLNYDLKKLNWFGLGGPAKIYFKPNNLNELLHKFVLLYCNGKKR